MSVYIDARLAEQVRTADETGLVEAVIVVQEREGDCLAGAEGGPAQQVVARAAERAGEMPQAVRYFPRANAAVITASRKFLVEVLRDEDLAAASAADVEPFPFA